MQKDIKSGTTRICDTTHPKKRIPGTFVNTLTEQDRIYKQRTSSRSFWSFCTKNDIRDAFEHDSKGADDQRLHVPEAFTDVFLGDSHKFHQCLLVSPLLLCGIRIYHTSIRHSGEQQVFNSFVSLPSGLPLTYGSLTD